jgi:hypothetical protein
MKVNIYGLTESTISFNGVGINLRGKFNEDPELFEPCSVAYNIDLKDQDQINEVNQIENIGLIRVERVEDKKEEVEVEETFSRRGKANSLEETKVETKEEIEEPVVDEVPSAVNLEVPVIEAYEERSDAIVMTTNGPKSGKMVNKMNGEIDENDPRCQASMEEAKKLDEEQSLVEDLIDESLLDPSERMGTKAIIGAGNGVAKVADMKNSVVGERAEPNFIDLLDDEEESKEEVNTKNAFIDLEDEEEDELGDAFIEI